MRTFGRANPELVVAALALLVGLAGVALGLPAVLPDATSLGFVERHYFRPFLLAVVLQSVMLLWRGRTRERGDRGALAGSVLLLLVTVLVHFNLKAWMPLVHKRLFDAELMRTDRALDGLVTLLIALRRGMAGLTLKLGLPFDEFYHGAFVAMFFTAFTAHAVADDLRAFRRVVLGACLVLLIGGLSYWILPAKGPFVFRISEGHLAREAQTAMEASFDDFVLSRWPQPGYFSAPLAAMPSLHMAHATLFTLFAFRRLRWLGWSFLALLGFIVIEAVAAGWHYFLDLPAGAALAVGCVWLSDRLLPEASAPSEGHPAAGGA